MSHFKRAIIVFLASIKLMSHTAWAEDYLDVQATYKHYKAITVLTEEGVLKGYANHEFRPEDLINRAEVVTIMSRRKFASHVIESSLLGHKMANHKYATFPDVPLEAWYAPFVEISYQNQIIRGFPDGYFKPQNNTTIAEALKIILESYKVDFSQNAYQPNKLLYVKSGEWFEKYFTYAHAHNLINQNKFYYPGQFITRGEFAEITHRLDFVLKNNGQKYIEKSEPTSNEYTITIPKLNIVNVNVSLANLYDASKALEVLKNGLGQYLNFPDTGKKTVLFGHSSGYSWDSSNYKTILREIDKLNSGDRIYINYKEKGYVFEVFYSEIIPASQDIKIVDNEKNHELALYTCWPPNSIKQRYVVYGKPI